jgi:putative ABC transport system substrate-binding protein
VFAGVGADGTYTLDLEETFRRAGSLAARILQGAKPADFPVEQPTEYQLVVNPRTALGLTIPPALLARADEVINRAHIILPGALVINGRSALRP